MTLPLPHPVIEDQQVQQNFEAICTTVPLLPTSHELSTHAPQVRVNRSTAQAIATATYYRAFSVVHSRVRSGQHYEPHWVSGQQSRHLRCYVPGAYTITAALNRGSGEPAAAQSVRSSVRVNGSAAPYLARPETHVSRSYRVGHTSGSTQTRLAVGRLCELLVHQRCRRH